MFAAIIVKPELMGCSIVYFCYNILHTRSHTTGSQQLMDTYGHVLAERERAVGRRREEVVLRGETGTNGHIILKTTNNCYVIWR